MPKPSTAAETPVAPCGLVDHGHIVAGRLVVLYVAAVGKGQLARGHQVVDQVPHVLLLLIPPALEERLHGK